MKKLLFFIVIFFYTSQIYAYEYSRETYTTSLGDYQIRLLRADLLGDDRFVVGVSDYGESLESLVKRYNGKAGISGSFFCPKDYSSCGGQNLTNADRFSYSENFSRWEDTGDRYVFAIDKDALAFLYHSSKLNSELKNDIYMGIGNHPLILKDGENMLEYYYDRGLIDKKMPSNKPKSFVCSTKKAGEILMGIVAKAHMDDLPTVLSEIGCVNALNLDAGLTLAFYNNGEYYVGPGRDMMDALIITDKAGDEKNKKILNLVSETKKSLFLQINKLIKDQSQKDLIIQKLVEKISKLIEKTNGNKKTLLILLKNDLLEELGKNIAFK